LPAIRGAFKEEQATSGESEHGDRASAIGDRADDNLGGIRTEMFLAEISVQGEVVGSRRIRIEAANRNAEESESQVFRILGGIRGASVIPDRHGIEGERSSTFEAVGERESISAERVIGAGAEEKTYVPSGQGGMTGGRTGGGKIGADTVIGKNTRRAAGIGLKPEGDDITGRERVGHVDGRDHGVIIINAGSAPGCSGKRAECGGAGRHGCESTGEKRSDREIFFHYRKWV